MQAQYRLRKRKHFAQVYRRGKSVSNRQLVMLFVPARQVQVGISVSKKLGGAVQRNFVKRRLRECVRPHLPNMRKGRYVVIARAGASDVNFRVLEESVKHLLTRGNYLL